MILAPPLTATLPTRRDEAWRYSDLDAVAAVWPVPAPERIDVAAGEEIARVIVQDAAVDAIAIHDYAVVLGAGARASFHVLNAGGRLGRVTIDVTLHEGAHFELGGAILGGGATGSYLGKVAVARHAQKTDASQSVKAMLLTRTATANAKPELEIYADDVKCAHGATVGELDANALFYLMSRGIAPAAAKALLLRGFIAGVFDDVADDAARAQIEAAASAALEGLVA